MQREQTVGERASGVVHRGAVNLGPDFGVAQRRLKIGVQQTGRHQPRQSGLTGEGVGHAFAEPKANHHVPQIVVARVELAGNVAGHPAGRQRVRDAVVADQPRHLFHHVGGRRHVAAPEGRLHVQEVVGFGNREGQGVERALHLGAVVGHAHQPLNAVEPERYGLGARRHRVGVG